MWCLIWEGYSFVPYLILDVMLSIAFSGISNSCQDVLAAAIATVTASAFPKRFFWNPEVHRYVLRFCEGYSATRVSL